MLSVSIVGDINVSVVSRGSTLERGSRFSKFYESNDKALVIPAAFQPLSIASLPFSDVG